MSEYRASGVPHAKNARIKMPFTWYSIVTSIFFLGRFPIAPGTIGSLAAWPIYYFVLMISTSYDEVVNTLMALSGFLFVLGWLAIDKFHASTRAHDHKSIIIDELVGQLIALSLCFNSLMLLSSTIGHYLEILDYKNISFVIAFILFRFYDIKKPLFIGYIDKYCRNGIGVMLDDVLAGIYAALNIYIVSLLII